MLNDILADWKQRPCVLATMHGKELVIAPLLKEALNIQMSIPNDFNTDRFGTFTRDITRAGNQLEAARKKALAAMDHTGLDFALASEGTFGTHPSLPFLPSNLEIVILVDKKNDLEIVGHYRTSSIAIRSQSVHTAEEAVSAAKSWGFPKQGVIVRLSEKNTRHIYKEITTLDALKNTTEKLLASWLTKSIFLETDMRAHRCPARMEAIKGATQDLVKNCQSLCSKCQTPGFVVTKVLKGLPCRDCGLPSDLAITLIYSCQKCNHAEQRHAEGDTTADPGQCERCNP